MKYCEFCDSGNDENVTVCTSCGGNDFYHRCPSCGKAMHGAIFCTDCGIRFDAVKSHCPICGTERFGGTCPTCARTRTAAQAAYVNPPQKASAGNPKNKWVAFCLCLLLGFYGAHKFYEGKLGMGLLYFFTAGLFGIGWVVDIFRILFLPTTYYV